MDIDKYKTVGEAAAIVGRSPKTVSYHCKKGKMPDVIRKGREWFIGPDGIAYLKTIMRQTKKG